MKKLMSITGWTKEDWKEFASDFVYWSLAIVLVMLLLYIG